MQHPPAGRPSRYFLYGVALTSWGYGSQTSVDSEAAYCLASGLSGPFLPSQAKLACHRTATCYLSETTTPFPTVTELVKWGSELHNRARSFSMRVHRRHSAAARTKMVSWYQGGARVGGCLTANREREGSVCAMPFLKYFESAERGLVFTRGIETRLMGKGPRLQDDGRLLMSGNR